MKTHSAKVLNELKSAGFHIEKRQDRWHVLEVRGKKREVLMSSPRLACLLEQAERDFGL